MDGAQKSCSCASCVIYKSESERPSLQEIIAEGSRIDRLYLGKYIPLREKKLLGKLLQTRAVYDDARSEYPSENEDNRNTAKSLKDKHASSECCSCCSCSSGAAGRSRRKASRDSTVARRGSRRRSNVKQGSKPCKCDFSKCEALMNLGGKARMSKLNNRMGRLSRSLDEGARRSLKKLRQLSYQSQDSNETEICEHGCDLKKCRYKECIARQLNKRDSERKRRPDKQRKNIVSSSSLESVIQKQKMDPTVKTKTKKDKVEDHDDAKQKVKKDSKKKDKSEGMPEHKLETVQRSSSTKTLIKRKSKQTDSKLQSKHHRADRAISRCFCTLKLKSKAAKNKISNSIKSNENSPKRAQDTNSPTKSGPKPELQMKQTQSQTQQSNVKKSPSNTKPQPVKQSKSKTSQKSKVKPTYSDNKNKDGANKHRHRADRALSRCFCTLKLKSKATKNYTAHSIKSHEHLPKRAQDGDLSMSLGTKPEIQIEQKQSQTKQRDVKTTPSETKPKTVEQTKTMTHQKTVVKHAQSDNKQKDGAKKHLYRPDRAISRCFCTLKLKSKATKDNIIKSHEHSPKRVQDNNLSASSGIKPELQMKQTQSQNKPINVKTTQSKTKPKPIKQTQSITKEKTVVKQTGSGNKERGDTKKIHSKTEQNIDVAKQIQPEKKPLKPSQLGGHALKRCFCTLKLKSKTTKQLLPKGSSTSHRSISTPKKNKTKTAGIKSKSDSKQIQVEKQTKRPKETQADRSLSLRENKPRQLQGKVSNESKKVMQITELKSQHSGTGIKEKEKLQQTKKRQGAYIKREPRSVPESRKTKSTSSLTPKNLVKAKTKRVQSSGSRKVKQKSKDDVISIKKVPKEMRTSRSTPVGKTAKESSNINTVPAQPREKVKTEYQKLSNERGSQGDTRPRRTSVQIQHQTTQNNNVKIGSALKRCFCTLKLHKAGRQGKKSIEKASEELKTPPKSLPKSIVTDKGSKSNQKEPKKSSNEDSKQKQLLDRKVPPVQTKTIEVSKSISNSKGTKMKKKKPKSDYHKGQKGVLESGTSPKPAKVTDVSSMTRVSTKVAATKIDNLKENDKTAHKSRVSRTVSPSVKHKSITDSSPKHSTVVNRSPKHSTIVDRSPKHSSGSTNFTKRQAVKIGSSFSFNIEFSKNRPVVQNNVLILPTNKLFSRTTKIKPICSKFSNTSSDDNSLSISTNIKRKKSRIESNILKRCICTLQLDKAKGLKEIKRGTAKSPFIYRMSVTDTPFDNNSYKQSKIHNNPVYKIMPYENESSISVSLSDLSSLLKNEHISGTDESILIVMSGNSSVYKQSPTQLLRTNSDVSTELNYSKYNSLRKKNKNNLLDSFNKRYLCMLNLHNHQKKINPYECPPRACIPDICDPKECRKMILKALAKKISQQNTSISSEAVRDKTKKKKHNSHKHKQGIYLKKNPKLKSRSDKSIVAQIPNIYSVQKKCFCTSKNFKQSQLETHQPPHDFATRKGILTNPRTKYGTPYNREGITNYAKESKPHHLLDPHECEPDICIPSHKSKFCDQSLSVKPTTQSSSVITDNIRKKIKNTQTDYKQVPGQSQRAKSATCPRKHIDPMATTNREAVKLGSSISIHMEFYKEKIPNTEKIQSAASCLKKKRKIISKSSSLAIDRCVSTKQSLKTRSQGTSPSSQCYCLKLQKKGRVPVEKKTVSKHQATDNISKLPAVVSKSVNVNLNNVPSKKCEKGVCVRSDCKPCDYENCIKRSCRIKKPRKVVMSKNDSKEHQKHRQGIRISSDFNFSIEYSKVALKGNNSSYTKKSKRISSNNTIINPLRRCFCTLPLKREIPVYRMMNPCLGKHAEVLQISHPRKVKNITYFNDHSDDAFKLSKKTFYAPIKPGSKKYLNSNITTDKKKEINDSKNKILQGNAGSSNKFLKKIEVNPFFRKYFCTFRSPRNKKLNKVDDNKANDLKVIMPPKITQSTKSEDLLSYEYVPQILNKCNSSKYREKIEYPNQNQENITKLKVTKCGRNSCNNCRSSQIPSDLSLRDTVSKRNCALPYNDYKNNAQIRKGNNSEKNKHCALYENSANFKKSATKSVVSVVGTRLKRCFCTLKLHKQCSNSFRSILKNHENPEQFGNNLKDTESFQMENRRQYNTVCKPIRNNVRSRTVDNKRFDQVASYGSENINRCPYKFQRARKRRMKEFDSSTRTSTKKSTSTSNTTKAYINKYINTSAHDNLSKKSDQKPNKYHFGSSGDANKSVVRIGSRFTLDMKFYKEQMQGCNHTPSTCVKPVKYVNKGTGECCNTQNKSTNISSVLKKCFCTLINSQQKNKTITCKEHENTTCKNGNMSKLDYKYEKHDIGFCCPCKMESTVNSYKHTTGAKMRYFTSDACNMTCPAKVKTQKTQYKEKNKIQVASNSPQREKVQRKSFQNDRTGLRIQSNFSLDITFSKSKLHPEYYNKVHHEKTSRFPKTKSQEKCRTVNYRHVPVQAEDILLKSVGVCRQKCQKRQARTQATCHKAHKSSGPKGVNMKSSYSLNSDSPNLRKCTTISASKNKVKKSLTCREQIPGQQVTVARVEVEEDWKVNGYAPKQFKSRSSKELNISPKQVTFSSVVREDRRLGTQQTILDPNSKAPDDIETIYPYIPKKFNKVVSNTYFIPPSNEHHKNKLDLKSKFTANTKSKTFISNMKSMFGHIKHFFKNKSRRNLPCPQHDETKWSNTKTHKNFSTKTKKRKNIPHQTSDFLKVSKSDRRTTKSKGTIVPEVSKSVKVTRVSTNEPEELVHTYYNSALKHYSHFQSGDTKRETIQVAEDKRMKSLICNELVCMYCQPQYSPNLFPFMNNKIVQLALESYNPCCQCRNSLLKSEKSQATKVPKKGVTCKTSNRIIKIEPLEISHKEVGDALLPKLKCRSKRPCSCCKLGKSDGSCVHTCKTVKVETKKKKKSKSKPNLKCDIPLFEMKLAASNLNLMNTDEIYEKVLKLAKQKKATAQAHLKNLRRLHGKQCKCCICKGAELLAAETKEKENEAVILAQNEEQNKRKKAKDENRKPCVCGSTKCSKLATKLSADKLQFKKLKKTSKRCVCGTKICAKEKLKQDVKKKLVNKKDVNKRLTEEQKKTMKVQRARQIKRERKQYLQQQKRSQIEQKKRIASQRKFDRKMAKEVRKTKDATNFSLILDSFVDVARLGCRVVYLLGKSIYRKAADPKHAWKHVKYNYKNVSKCKTSLKHAWTESGTSGTCKRIGTRMTSLKVCRFVRDKLLHNSLGRVILSLAVRDPMRRKKLLKSVKKKRPPRMPMNFECSLYMASLKKKPHWQYFFMCPAFYPHIVSLVKMWKHFVEILLFICAIIVWSPCILCIECLRAMMCCTLCTQ